MQLDSFYRSGSLLLILAIGCAGCGQSEYDSRMDGISAVLRSRPSAAPTSKNAQSPVPPGMLMDEYFSVTDAAGAKQGLKLRLPMQYSGATSLSDGQPGAKVWFLTIPGFCYTMQTQVADETGKQFPAYCHLYSVKKSELPPEQLREQILASATAADAAAKWIASPHNGEAGFVTWHVLKVGRQFDYQIDGATENRRENVFVETNEAAENTIVICWQFEVKSANASKLFEAHGYTSESVVLE